MNDIWTMQEAASAISSDPQRVVEFRFERTDVVVIHTSNLVERERLVQLYGEPKVYGDLLIFTIKLS